MDDLNLYDICITVNDREIKARVKAETSLLDFLRENNFMLWGNKGSRENF